MTTYYESSLDATSKAAQDAARSAASRATAVATSADAANASKVAAQAAQTASETAQANALAVQNRNVNTGTGLTGGGNLTADRTIAVDFATSGVSSTTKAVRADDARLPGTVALDSGQSFVVVDSEDRIVFAPTTSTAPIADVGLPSLDWAHWGDSLTDDRETGAGAWVTKLAALTGRNHFNGGWYSQQHQNIAARQGGLPALVTLPSNVVPASGTVTVSSIVNKPTWVSTRSPTPKVYGTLNGARGYLSEATTDVITFTRSPDGPSVACPVGTRFIPEDGVTYRDRIVTLESGRNSLYDTDPRFIVASIQAMIGYLSPGVKRVMVFDVPPSTTNIPGDSGRTRLDALNAALKAAFPAYYLDVFAWLRTAEAATAAGITFTAQDNTDIANGITPTSFRLDTLHLNATGCTAVAYKVRQEAQLRGWIV